MSMSTVSTKVVRHLESKAVNNTARRRRSGRAGPPPSNGTSRARKANPKPRVRPPRQRQGVLQLRNPMASDSKLPTARLEYSRAPDHPTYGRGDRLTIHTAPLTIGRSGVGSFAAENRVVSFSYGGTSSYASSVSFGGLHSSAMTTSTPVISYCGSTYSASGAPPVNLCSETLKFYHRLTIRSVTWQYTAIATYLTPGDITIAPTTEYATTGEVKTFDDVVAKRGSVSFHCFENASGTLLSMSSPNTPGTITINSPWGNISATLFAMVATDSPLTTATSDKLGHLNFTVVCDCYDKQWIADETVPAESAAELSEKLASLQTAITSLTASSHASQIVLPKVRDPAQVKDQKEAKEDRHDAPDVTEWETVEAQRRVDLRALRTALNTPAQAQTSQSTSSVTTGTAAPLYPNAAPRPARS